MKRILMTIVVLGALLLGGFQLLAGTGPKLPLPPPCQAICIYDVSCPSECWCEALHASVACNSCVPCEVP